MKHCRVTIELRTKGNYLFLAQAKIDATDHEHLDEQLSEIKKTYTITNISKIKEIKTAKIDESGELELISENYWDEQLKAEEQLMKNILADEQSSTQELKESLESEDSRIDDYLKTLMIE